MTTLTRPGNQGFLRTIGLLALPVALQSALVASLSLADVLMVSDLGQEATAAVGAASRWHFIAIMVMAALANANGSLVAQYWGKGGISEAKSVAVLAIRQGILIFLPITALVALLASPMLSLQSTDARVIALGASYLWVSLPVLLLTHVVISLEASLRSSGQTWLPMLLATFTILLNIALNHWFIRGGLGVPAMGVAGAALATTVARVIQLGLFYWVLSRQNNWLLRQPGSDKQESLSQQYRTLSLPLILNSLLWAFGTLLYQVLIGRMGTAELAVYSMLGPFESLCHATFFGLSVACAVVVGQSLGQSKFDQASKMAARFIRLTLGGSLLLGLGIGLNHQVLLGWLNLDSPELIAMAAPAFLVMCGAMWLKMLNLILIHGILRAGGENHFCLRTDFKAMWLVGIPLTAYGAIWGGWPFALVYLAMFSEELVKLVLSLRHYLRRAWHNNLTQSPVRSQG